MIFLAGAQDHLVRGLSRLGIFIVISCFLSLSGVAYALVWAASNSLGQATALYDQGNYKAASDILSPAVEGELKSNATAHYYLANALAKLGRQKEAYKQYALAKSLSRDANLSTYCQQGMDIITGGGAAGGGTDARAKSSGGGRASTAGTGASGQETSKTRQEYDALYPDPAKLKVDPKTLDTSMVTVVRRSENTNFVLYQIDQALRKLPADVKQTLQGGGLQIIVSPTLVDACPELAGDRPSVYLHGGGYENCPGFFDGTGKIYIPEKVQYRSNVAQVNGRVLQTILHEMGHAFDHYKAGLSRREPYSKDYEEDMGRLTMTEKTKHYYYTQADAGPAESFAELFSFVINPSELKFDAEAADLARCFPRCMAEIKKLTK